MGLFLMAGSDSVCCFAVKCAVKLVVGDCDVSATPPVGTCVLRAYRWRDEVTGEICEVATFVV